MPVKTSGPRAVRPGGERLEERELVGEAARRPPDRVRLTRDLRDEWVRKVS